MPEVNRSIPRSTSAIARSKAAPAISVVAMAVPAAREASR